MVTRVHLIYQGGHAYEPFFLLKINDDDDDKDTKCISFRCEVSRKNGCLKNGEHVPAFGIFGMYRFLVGISTCGLSPRHWAFH